MADVIKLVDRIVPVQERSQNFTQADVVAGDVILVKESLGHSARNITIEAVGGELVVSFNVKQKVYPTRGSQHHTDFLHCDHYPIPIMGQSIELLNGITTIEAGTVYEWEDDIAVRDIKIVSFTASSFDIFVS